MDQVVKDLEYQERAARALWTSIIVGFFLIQAVIWAVAITLTSSDQSHAVVASYDERALNWDAEVASRKASDDLGWNAALVVDEHGDFRGNRPLTVTLVGSDGEPIVGAHLELTAFHRAAAGRPQTIDLIEDRPGVYIGQITVRKSGRWQFSGTAKQGPAIFRVGHQQRLKVGQ